MPDLPRFAMHFGAGLDRETGLFAAPPGSMEELVNVYVSSGKAEMRRGLAVTCEDWLDAAGDPLTADYVVLVEAMRAEGVGIVVLYDSASGDVHVVRVTGAGTSPTYIAKWGTLGAGAAVPPRVFAAEVYGKMFLAHDEPALSERLPTVYYDPTVPGLTTLTVDWDPGNPGAPMKFRGVARHMAYLIGWGYGTPTEARPEMVRCSMPGEPTDWDINHYWIAGHRNDPVLRVLPIGELALVLKEAESYAIHGYDRATFGIRPADPLFGIAASRLAVALGGAGYVWTLEGPRLMQGGASVDLELPLDLDGPQPADLVAEGALDDAFGVYVPGRRVIDFVFGRRVYTLNIRQPDNPRWTYKELGAEVFCGGTLYAGGAIAPSFPPGYVEMVSVEDSGANEADPLTLRDVAVKWKNWAMAGDELIEVWLKVGGVWEAAARETVAYQPLAEQQVTIEGLASLSQYEVAVRARRGNTYRAGYTDADPGLWDAISRMVFETSALAPTLTGVWQRVDAATEKIAVTLDVFDSTQDTQIRRAGGALVATLPAGTTTHDVVLAAGEGEDYVGLYAEHTSAVADGPAGEELRVWAGPPPPQVLLLQHEGMGLYVEYDEVVPVGGDVEDVLVEVWTANRTLGHPLSEALVQARTDYSAIAYPNEGAGAQQGETHEVRLRNRVRSFGVDDWSEHTPYAELTW